MTEARRGKSYVCLHCEAAGRAYVEVLYRVRAHIYKHHLALDKAPFYCTLCLLRCSTKSALINHVTKYSRHRLAATEMGTTSDKRYLVENPRPAELVYGKDFREISTLEAARYITRENVDDVTDVEGEFYREPAPVVSSVPKASTSTSGAGLINVQLTPEMLATLLQSQPVQNKGNYSSLQQTTSTSTKVTEVPLYSPAAVSVPSYMPTPAVPSYIPTPAVPSYIPTPAVPSCVSTPTVPSYTPTPMLMRTPPLLKSSPFVSAVSMPQVNCPQTTVMLNSTATSSYQPKVTKSLPLSTLSTPRLNSSTEDIMPTLLGDMDTFGSEFDYGLDSNWLEGQATDQQGSNESSGSSSECPQPTVTPSMEGTKSEETNSRGEDRELKRTRQEDEQEHCIKFAKIIDDSTKQLVAAFETNSRAIRGVDRTLGQVLVVMSKMNRTLERMGEEQRREHESRREENQRRDREENQRRDREEMSRRVDEKRDNSRIDSSAKKHEGKENRPLKSTVKKV